MKKHISLSITERCNLNCIYCFEKSKLKSSMAFETAIKVLTYELENSPGYDEISCDFMGGEPFLEFELIKKVCEYFWTRENAKKISFYTTTNGTLVHGEIKEWLKQHKDKFMCMLSLDGQAESHNHNRSNSFDRIDIPFFLAMWPVTKVKAITSKDTLGQLCDNIIFLHELGFKNVEMKLAYGFDWNDKSVNDILREQLNKLKPYYLCHEDIKPCSLLNVDFLKVTHSGKPIQKWCNAGEKTVSYDMQGTRYPCRYFQDLVKGKHITHEEIWQYDYLSIQNTLRGRCVDCKIRDLCRTCYAYNFELHHDFGLKDPVSCINTRTTLVAAAELYVERTDKAVENTDQVLYENAKCICAAATDNDWFIK